MEATALELNGGRGMFHVEQMSRDSTVTKAPQWLVRRMEALRKLPAPTLQEVETSFRAAEEQAAKADRSLISFLKRRDAKNAEGKTAKYAKYTKSDKI